MDYGVRGLRFNAISEDELAAHGLSPADVDAVFERQPRFARQRASIEDSAEGGTRRRPGRLRMIGPNNSGRVLAFVLEYPDANGISHVVTGWRADDDELAKYRQLGGRRR